MKAWAAVRRATLLIPSGPSHDPSRRHLHIVLNDPFDDGAGERVVLASVCTILASAPYDPSCTLFPGEHEFIKNHSYIAYRFCVLADPQDLEQRCADGEFTPKPLLDEKFFQMVVDGVFESPQVAPKFRKFLTAANAYDI